MSIKRVEVGKRMSQLVVHNDTVYTAGQVAEETAGKSVAEQTREILARIDALLAEAGTDKTRILTAQVWLSDISPFDEMNSVWDEWVPEGNAPARACVEGKLVSPKYAVEIMVVAAK